MRSCGNVSWSTEIPATLCAGFKGARAASSLRRGSNNFVRSCRLLLLFGHFQPGLGALQIAGGSLEIFFSVAGGELRFCTLFGLTRTSCVNLIGTLCGLGENGYLVRQHFRESPSYREMVSVISFAIGNLSNCEF